MFCAGILLGPESGGPEADPVRPPLPPVAGPQGDFDAVHRARLAAAAESCTPGEKAEIERLAALIGAQGAYPDEKVFANLASLGEKAVPALAALLESGDAETKGRAAEVLGEIRSNLATHCLAAGLLDESWEVQAFCAEALGEVGDGSAEPDLLRWQCETADRKRQTRVAVAAALSRLGSSEGLPVLVNALYWDVFNVKAAAKALEDRTGLKFGLAPGALRVEREKGADLWAGWFNSCGAAGLARRSPGNTDESRLAWRIRREIEQLGSERYYYTQKAKETLAGAGATAYPYVLDALYFGSPSERFHPSFQTRMGACHVLEMMTVRGMPCPGAADHLAFVVRTDASGAVRAAAAQALGRAGDRRSVGALLRVLGGDSDMSARIEAAISLGRLGFTDALEGLGKAASAPGADGELALESAWACEVISGGTGLAALAGGLEKALSSGNMIVAERAHRRLVETTCRNPMESRSVPSLSAGERAMLVEGWKRTASKHELVRSLKDGLRRGDLAAVRSAVSELALLYRPGNISREIPTALHSTSAGSIAVFWERLGGVWIAIDRMKAAAEKGDYVAFARDSRMLGDMFGFGADCNPGMDSAGLKEVAARWAAWALETDPF